MTREMPYYRRLMRMMDISIQEYTSIPSVHIPVRYAMYRSI